MDDIANKIVTYIRKNGKMMNSFIKFIYMTNNRYWKPPYSWQKTVRERFMTDSAEETNLYTEK